MKNIMSINCNLYNLSIYVKHSLFTLTMLNTFMLNIIKCAQNKGCTHVQYVNNHKVLSLNMKDLKLLESQITQTRHPLVFQMDKISSSTGVKIRKYLSNVHKIEGAHVQCMNNHYAKFEY